MTEKEKMLQGKIYNALDPVFPPMQEKLHRLQACFNAMVPGEPGRQELLLEFCPGAKEDTSFRGPVYFDYGCFTTFGKGFYANYHCTILDVCPVTIGDYVLFGPNVSLLTPMHPLDYRDRHQSEDDSLEYAKPIVIEDGVWLCGNVTVLGGVTIGKGSVIGAGSVVTRDIPPGVIAFGNPCKVRRKIEEKDRLRFHPELF